MPVLTVLLAEQPQILPFLGEFTNRGTAGNVLRGFFGDTGSEAQVTEGSLGSELMGESAAEAQEFTGKANPGAGACLSVCLGADPISWAAAPQQHHGLPPSREFSGSDHISLAEP